MVGKEESQLSQLILFNLFVIGLNPWKCNRTAIFLRMFLLVDITSLLISTLVDLDWNITEDVSRVLLIPGMFVGTCKCLFLIFKQKKMKMLLQGTELLWNVNMFGAEVEDKMRKHQKFAYKYMGFYVYAGFASVFFNLARDLWDGYELIIPCYTLCDITTTSCYDIYMIWQIIFCLIHAIPLTMGFDGFFLHMITECYVGIEMIKVGFEKMLKDPERFDTEMNEIIIQHNLVLQFVKETNELFVYILLLQFACSLISQMFCLFMLTLDGFPPDIDKLSTYGTPYLVFILQLLLYCSAGNLIMVQTLSLGDAAYGVQWYKKHYIKLRKPLATIILRSQRAETMSIGNIAPLTLETYLNITLIFCGIPLTMGFDGIFLHMITECYIGIEMMKVGFEKMFKDPKLLDLDIKDT
ncbi:PREDICTED: uncharacterized protein LOC108562931, partial [Nicrophorus vespilloides]|uniref:Odorant receptor n=1 Tax=Nicrophorus vespilloides TaxID=110193 RepID=A0ABM1MQT2_NICVS